VHLLELIPTDIDDPSFIALANSFVSHYLELHRPDRIVFVHVDNFFGERWLGFAGKFNGIAGIRQRRGKLGNNIATPPFRPSRIVSTTGFMDIQSGNFTSDPTTLHVEKNGGIVWRLDRPALYFWYSGNTMANTTSSLMIYDITKDGQNAWYVQFDRKDDGGWQFTKCRNVASEECIRITNTHNGNIVG